MASKKNAPTETAVVDEEEIVKSESKAPPPPAPETKPKIADPEIARVAETLKLPSRKERKAAAAGDIATYVVDPSGKNGELHHDGKVYKPGDEVKLDAETAKGLGKLVVAIDDAE